MKFEADLELKVAEYGIAAFLVMTVVLTFGMELALKAKLLEVWLELALNAAEYGMTGLLLRAVKLGLGLELALKAAEFGMSVLPPKMAEREVAVLLLRTHLLKVLEYLLSKTVD